jgi:hypothetical protein
MEDREQAEFNMAVSFLNRLNALFYMADEAAINLNAYLWFHTLMALYRELSQDAKDTEIQNLINIKKSISPLLSSNIEHQKKMGAVEINSELYDKLHDFEIQLRQILKSSGLLMKMKEDASHALKG